MHNRTRLHSDRLFPADSAQRDICRELYSSAKDLPIISPHGHTDPSWFAENAPFSNPSDLLILPDHYLLRMLYSQGVPLEHLGIRPNDSTSYEKDSRRIWQIFADNYYLFAGTPTRTWMDHVFYEVFGMTEAFGPKTADLYFDTIERELNKKEAYLPRNLLDQFNIRLLATTESALDPLNDHQALEKTSYSNRVITTFRPDDVVDPEHIQFNQNIDTLAGLTGFNTSTWNGYLDALRARRAFFKERGRATATDHGHPSALTADLDADECQTLLDKCLKGTASAAEKELFRAQMLTEMAGMSLEDGLVMQIHPGSYRNHNASLFQRFGPDKGADIPKAATFTEELRPLLNRYGNEANFNLIVFTLDESSYARDLAPLAGHYPCLTLGPAWWFHDSPQGMLRYRDQVTETAGFYNTAGFNDDTRAFFSIPARHDVARRMDAHYLSSLVVEHKITQEEASSIMIDLSYNLALKAYKLPLATIN